MSRLLKWVWCMTAHMFDHATLVRYKENGSFYHEQHCYRCSRSWGATTKFLTSKERQNLGDGDE